MNHTSPATPSKAVRTLTLTERDITVTRIVKFPRRIRGAVMAQANANGNLDRSNNNSTSPF